MGQPSAVILASRGLVRMLTAADPDDFHLGISVGCAPIMEGLFAEWDGDRLAGVALLPAPCTSSTDCTCGSRVVWSASDCPELR
jgi:hypothetical protein